jgi:hypothetical protein
MPTESSPQPPSAKGIDGGDAGTVLRESVDSAASVGTVGVSIRRRALLVGLLLGTGFLLCLLGYLALAVPSNWFPAASAKAWGAPEMKLARGSGGIVGDEMLVSAVDPSGMAVVSVNADLRATDFSAIAWIAADLPEDADVRLIWRTDVQPQKMSSARVTVTAGQPMPVILVKDGAWIGRVSGIALVIRAKLAKPIRIRGVVAKPMGAMEILRDRSREWLAFEGWTGASINTVVGGADVQDLPLPPLMAAACAIAGALLLALGRWRPGLTSGTTGGLLLALFAVAWLVLDARWTWDLVRQERITLRDYGGRSSVEKHLAAEDAALFAVVEKARHVMPETPVRVFVVADARYFRERAAYHLYPHNVFTDRVNGTMPPARALRPGDWLFDYEGRGILYDTASGNLRWDGNQAIAAEPKLIVPGAALFLIR